MRMMILASATLATFVIATAFTAPVVAAEIDMSGTTYLTFTDVQDEETDFHFKGVVEGMGIFVADNPDNPVMHAIIDFDGVYHSAKRDDIEYIQRTGAYGAMILTDADDEYLILSYVRHPGEQVQWTANGGSGKYANASGNGGIVFETLPSFSGKFTFSGSITID